MTEKTKAETMRRPYEPPQLEQVQLVAEEAVLQGCKTPGGGPGPSDSPACRQIPGPGTCLADLT